MWCGLGLVLHSKTNYKKYAAENILNEKIILFNLLAVDSHCRYKILIYINIYNVQRNKMT